MGIGVEDVAPALELDTSDLSDNPLGEEVAGLEPDGVVGALKGDDELDGVAPAGHQHAVGLAEVAGHRLLAENGLRAPCGRGYDHLGVLLVPGADIDEVRPFLVEHLAVIGVSVLLADAEEVPELPQGVRVGVGKGADLDGPAGNSEPAAGVDAAYDAAGDDCGAVLCHERNSGVSGLDGMRSEIRTRS